MQEAIDYTELFHRRRMTAAALTVGHEMPKDRKLFVRRPGWQQPPDAEDALSASATMPRHFLAPAMDLRLRVEFEPNTAVPLQFSCIGPDGQEIGENPFRQGHGFHFRHPGAPTRMTWSDGITRLHAHVQYQIQPHDEIGYASLLVLEQLLDYTEAIDRELPGVPIPVGSLETMLHNGPDTTVGRALFNCIKRMGNDGLWYCQAVATLWVAHGEKIEANCVFAPPAPAGC